MLSNYSDIFKADLGTSYRLQGQAVVKSGKIPKFCKALSIPFAIKGAIERELNRLEAAGIMERMILSDWAAPIVAIPKKDGGFWICEDYRVTVNGDLDVGQHPLPNPSELFATFAGGKKFTKLDLSQVYQQLLLDQESTKYVTVNIQKELYRYNRLPFGIASAPTIFRKTLIPFCRALLIYVILLTSW